nr:chain a, heme oxygenase (HMOX) [Polytomella parva]
MPSLVILNMSDHILFTDTLRKSSRKIHDLSDTLVNAKLVGLLTDKKLWGQSISNFYQVFKALEQQLTINFCNPRLQIFEAPLSKIFRTSAFEKDLEYFLGKNWEEKVHATPAIKEYIDHVKYLGMRDPVLLLVHAYTQHLAITSGGQIIRRVARKQFKLPEDAGTFTFDFDQYDLKRDVAEFKRILNEFADGLSEAEREKLIAEHSRVFRFNNAIVSSFNIPVRAAILGYLRLLPHRKLATVAVTSAAIIVALRLLSSSRS